MREIRRPAAVLILLVALLVAGTGVWGVACGDDGAGDPTGSTGPGSGTAGDIEGTAGEDIKVGDAVVNVRALQPTFRPANPGQRISDEPGISPVAGESFYQAYVKIQNNGVSPVRVDAEDFTCAVGDLAVDIEPTRSGPPARSLLKNGSLELLLTFKGPAGYEPVLIYTPGWYDGTIRIKPAATGSTETTA